MKAWINGEFVGLDKANVSLLSHSFSRGSAIFEVFDIVLTENGPAFFGINEHIDRLFRSAELMYMELPFTKDEIIDACIKTAKKNNVKSGGTKLFAYYPSIGFTALPDNRQVDIAIFCVDFDALNMKQEELSAPVTAGISTFRKMHPEILPVHAKITGSYVNAYLALTEIKKKGYDDVITMDMSGHVAEGATSSIFFVKDKKIKTPKPYNVLLGITRMAVIELVNDSKIQFEETDVSQAELNDIDEAFYSVSIQHIQPIISIDGKKIGDSCPGPVTKKIIALMNELLSGTNKKYEKWLTYIK